MICVIPARGGSKRLPAKNIREFFGQPMILWAIEAANKSRIFDKVVVATDCEKTADIVKGHAEVYETPAHLATDDVCMTEPVRVIAEGAACMMYATAPYIRAGDLVAGAEAIYEGWDYSIAAFKAPQAPQRQFKVYQGQLQACFPDEIEKAPSSYEKTYFEAGQFIYAKDWSKKPEIFTGKTKIIEVPPWHCVDINTREDWDFAERLGFYHIQGAY